MSKDYLDIVKELIENQNHVELKSYLERNLDDITFSISPELFTKAFYNFIESDSHNVENNFKVLEVLSEHFNHTETKKRYHSNDDYKTVSGLFNIHQKISNNKKLTVSDHEKIGGLGGFTTTQFQDKFTLLKDTRNEQVLVQKVEGVTKKEFIGAIVRETSSNKKVGNKLEYHESEFTKKLPDFIEKLHQEIATDSKTKGKFTDFQISQAIYFSICNFAKKDLGLDQVTIDKAFIAHNTKQLEKHGIDDGIKFVVPHLIELPEDLSKLPMNLKNVLISNLHKQIESYVGNVDREYALEASLKQLKKLAPQIFERKSKDLALLNGQEILIPGAVLGKGFKDVVKITIDSSNSIERCVDSSKPSLDYQQTQIAIEYLTKLAIKTNTTISSQLNKVESSINSKAVENHIKKLSNTRLSDLEKRVIQLYENIGKEELSQEDKHVMKHFFESMKGDKNFGNRIEKIQKENKESFPSKHVDTLGKLIAFNNAVSNIDHIIKLLDKLDATKSLVTTKELGLIDEFLKVETILNDLEKAGIHKDSDSIRRLIATFERAKASKDIELDQKTKKLDIEKISTFIEESNFEGLKTHFERSFKDTATKLPPEIFTTALDKFISSNANNRTNAYRVIEELEKHVKNENNIAKYKRDPEYAKAFAIFDVKNHKRSDLKDFDLSGFKEKIKIHEDNRTIRSVYNKLDKLIENDLLQKVLNPSKEKLSQEEEEIGKAIESHDLINKAKFQIRKALGLKHERRIQDVEQDFNDGLKEFLEKARKTIEEDPAFKDKAGNFILSDSELSQAIYERLSLKARKRLQLSQDSVDFALADVASQNINNVISSNKKDSKEFQDALSKAIPIHLINFKTINLADSTLEGAFGWFSNTWIANMLEINPVAPKKLFNSALESHLNALISQVNFYQNKPGREELLEKSLIPLIGFYKKLAAETNISVNNKDISRYENLLAATQQKIHEDLLARHNKKANKPKDSLTEYETRGILLLNKYNLNREEGVPLTKDILTEEENKFLTQFLEYSMSNKEFNSRLGRTLKRNDDFVVKNHAQLGFIHKFTFKSAEVEIITKALDKMEFILNKQKEDPNYKFSKDEKLTVAEIGKVNRLIGARGIVEFLKDNKFFKNSEDIQKLINAHERAIPIMKKFNQQLDKSFENRGGDLVMDSRKAAFELNGQSRIPIHDRIFTAITAFGHAGLRLHSSTFLGKYRVGKALGVQEKDIQAAEVFRAYTHGNITSGTSLLAEVHYNILPDKLIHDKKLKAELCNALGVTEDKLENKLHEMYQKIQAEFGANSSLSGSGTHNEFKKWLKAGVADFIPFGHRSDVNIREWAEKAINDPHNLGEHIKDPKNKDVMFCSEFSGRMITICLVKLEKDLIEEMKKKDPNFVPPKSGLIKMPFHEYEDLGKMHPERLVKLLQKSGALQEMRNPEFVQNAIRER